MDNLNSTQKKLFYFLISVIVVFIVAFIYLVWFTNPIQDPVVKAPPQNLGQATTTPSVPKTIPEEYVTVADSSAFEANFVFAVPVKSEDIKAVNIRHCIVSGSAGAVSRGDLPDCSETSSANKFSLKYDQNTRTLVITSEPSDDWGRDMGPFRIGCASCVSSVEFSGIHTIDGDLLPRKMVAVY